MTEALPSSLASVARFCFVGFVPKLKLHSLFAKFLPKLTLSISDRKCYIFGMIEKLKNVSSSLPLQNFLMRRTDHYPKFY